MNKIVFIDDFFVDQLLGGGELNNDQVIKELIVSGFEVEKINSVQVTVNFAEKNKNNFLVIGNFIGLHKTVKDYITQNNKYVIYEHDHKYLVTRNPAQYQNYVAPKEHVVNVEFYKKAVAVLCQSSFQQGILLKNVDLKNTVNLSGNMWAVEHLELIRELSRNAKKDCCAIMQSRIAHKNTEEAIMYCKYKNLPFELIQSAKYEDFLRILSGYSRLVFFPKTPETLSRIAVEARMLNMSVITNERLGATYENWFSNKGEPLIDIMLQKRKEVIETIKAFIK